VSGALLLAALWAAELSVSAALDRSVPPADAGLALATALAAGGAWGLAARDRGLAALEGVVVALYLATAANRELAMPPDHPACLLADGLSVLVGLGAGWLIARARRPLWSAAGLNLALVAGWCANLYVYRVGYSPARLAYLLSGEAWALNLGLALAAALGALALRRAPPPGPRSPSRARAAVAGLALLTLGLLLAGRPSSDASDSGGDGLNIVLLSVDALRPDHLGAYGYDRPTSPNLDAFAEQAVIFEHAVSPSNTSPTTLASWITGRYPVDHGLYGRFVRYPEEGFTWPSALRAAGWRTGAFIGVDDRAPFGFDDRFEARNFDAFEPPVDPLAGFLLPGLLRGVAPALYPSLGSADPRPPPLSRLVDRAVEWLADSEAPAFLFLHALEPHAPYLLPTGAAPTFGESGDEAAALNRAYMSLSLQGTPELDAALPRLVDLYDDQIAYVDAQLGRLLGALEASGRLEDSLIVVTADHGEAFMEHGLGFHANSLYGEVVRVPLMMRFPGGWRGGERIAQPVSTLDVLATAAALTGVDPGSGAAGVDLRAIIDGGERGPVFSDMQWGSAALDDSWKLVRVDRRWEAELGRYYLGHTALVELYDLSSDPDEARSLAGEGRREEAALLKLLDERQP